MTAQLRCYEPEPVDETWARLRHLGTRREQLVSEISGQVQQMRDLLECVWPAVLDTARQPFRSRSWIAALSVALERVQLLLQDWMHAHQQLADTEARMSAVLDELDLSELVPRSPACHRSGPPPSWPRPATRTGSPPPAPWSSTPGSPHGRSSGMFVGRTRLSGAGRPSLRLAWGAAWGAQRANPVYRAATSTSPPARPTD